MVITQTDPETVFNGLSAPIRPQPIKTRTFCPRVAEVYFEELVI
jgi:hypothetical protein